MKKTQHTLLLKIIKKYYLKNTHTKIKIYKKKINKIKMTICVDSLFGQHTFHYPF